MTTVAQLRDMLIESFDDRIDFTFYVDAEEYLPILFFESWIKYVTGSGSSDSNNEKANGIFIE